MCAETYASFRIYNMDMACIEFLPRCRTGRQSRLRISNKLWNTMTSEHNRWWITGCADKVGQPAGALGGMFLEFRGLTICRLSHFHTRAWPNFRRFDASGNILQHYSDGDLEIQDTPLTRNPEYPYSLYIWGQIYLAFLTGKVDNTGKLPPAYPATSAPVAVKINAWTFII